jgi:hypothetical protein
MLKVSAYGNLRIFIGRWIFLIAGAAICLLHVEICNGDLVIRVQRGHTVLFQLGHSFRGFVPGSPRTYCAACQLGRG